MPQTTNRAFIALAAVAASLALAACGTDQPDPGPTKPPATSKPPTSKPPTSEPPTSKPPTSDPAPTNPEPSGSSSNPDGIVGGAGDGSEG